jgi:16S rRNA (adenine1518-N6/adenine1519-N6)-dimethyltransferase
MDKLTNPGYVSRLLADHGIRLKSKWGQNFLVDGNILAKIVKAAEVTKEDTILEVGAGIGALTVELAKVAGKVVTLEIDKRLVGVLSETLSAFDNIEVVHTDAMDMDYTRFKKAKVVANLPYNVASPLLFRWLKQYGDAFSLFIFMVQKEVAQRIVAVPGSKEYGSLSVVCQYAAEAKLLFTVPKTVFFPRPDVSSAVVLLRARAIKEDVDRDLFFSLVDIIFQQRRKMLLNTLSTTLAIEKSFLVDRAKAVGLDLTRRGETLSITEFANLTRLIYNIRRAE